MAELVQRPGGTGGVPSQIDEAKRQKLLELVRGRALARPTDLAEDEVMVWPSLVVVEAVCATVFLLILLAASVLVNAPLTARANPNQTPNPSKAPWYFLNLQELLLHMNPALAGVIVPTIALGLIAIIPYVDRTSRGLGVWFYSARGPKIMIFTTVYTIAVTAVLIGLDKFFPLKANFSAWLSPTGIGRATSTGFLSFLTQAVGGSTEKGQTEALGTLIE